MEAKLIELMERVNKLLVPVMDGSVKINGAINRKHLYCVSTSFVYEAGQTFFLVLVEEASPDSVELQRYLYLNLKEDYGSIEIETAW